MPAPDRFASAEAYYAAFFHELTHWTGHASRLNRPGITEPIRFGSERYSREELTAEMGAAFLCAMTGTDVPVLENQAAYIAGWLRKIRNGSAADVIRAAADAQRATDFLTRGGEEASSFLGDVTGQSFIRIQCLSKLFPGSFRCLESPAPSLKATEGDVLTDPIILTIPPGTFLQWGATED